MGWFIGRYVYDTHMSHLAHKHASLMPVVVPFCRALEEGLWHHAAIRWTSIAVNFVR
jgi:hypothetical protein